MDYPVKAAQIMALHQQANTAWHNGTPLAQPPGELMALIRAQHRENYDLWHEEDKARDPDASDATITAVKHAIDSLNQHRNDLAEQIDFFLLDQAGPQNDAAPLHSETPGLIIDRLSILSLKIFHTEEQIQRTSASERLRCRNRERLALLLAQRQDLAACLDQLWTEILAGKRRFKVYRQLKMYNDPELNPVLYGRAVPVA
jgi:hypothetical protein